MKLIVTYEADLIPGKPEEVPTLRLGKCIDVRQRDEVLANAVEYAMVEAESPVAALRFEAGWPWLCDESELSGTPHLHAASGGEQWRDESAAAEAERQRQR